MKINIVRRKLVKPNTPTPQTLKTHKISFLDELAPPVNTGCLLFYPSKPQQNSHLEESLAEILTRFYPLAGRYIKSRHIIDCSDEGAEFIEAEAFDLEMVNVVGKAEHIYHFFPRASHEVDKPTIPILSVQITRFKCGGAAIGACITHRLCDGSTLKAFLAAWVNASNQSQRGVEMSIIPTFHEASQCFPGRNWDYPNSGPSSFEEHGIVVRRICFDKEAISKLRSKLQPKAENGKVPYFSKVLVVSAVIAKALICMDRAKYGKSRDCLLNQAIDMRGKTFPPLREHACGNLLLQALSSCIPTQDATAEIEIQLLLDLMADAITKSKSDCAKVLAASVDGFNDIVLKRVKEELPRVVSGETYVLWFSDCTKMGFYEADFGSGKPVWACMAPQHSPNTIVLTSNAQGDGIEAMVHLHKSDIHMFEHVQQINMSKL